MDHPIRFINSKLTIMKDFTELSDKDKELLLQFPAYVSLLAANMDDEIDQEEKKAALWLTHIKTFSTEPALHAFYKQAETIFEKNMQLLDDQLPKTRAERTEAIQEALLKIDQVLHKMNTDYVSSLRRSMKSYKNHVSKAHRNILEYFIFPLPIEGISD